MSVLTKTRPDTRPVTEIIVTRPRNQEGKTGFFRLRRGVPVNKYTGIAGRFFFCNLWEHIRKERRSGRRVIFTRAD